MERREFLQQSLAGGAALIANPLHGAGSAKAFNMKFSPDFGIFKAASGESITDQIKWGYDQGFRAWENTGLKFRPVSEQESISKTVQQLGMEFGQFVGTMTFEHVT